MLQPDSLEMHRFNPCAAHHFDPRKSPQIYKMASWNADLDSGTERAAASAASARRFIPTPSVGKDKTEQTIQAKVWLDAPA